MGISSFINTAQVSLNEFKTFIIQQATLHPITTIVLVVLPFLGIAALGVWGLRKVYQSYNSPTVEKIKSVDNPVIQQTPPPKPVVNDPTTDKQSAVQNRVKGDVAQKQITLSTAVKIAATATVFFLGLYMTCYSIPTVFTEAYSGYSSNLQQKVVPLTIKALSIPVNFLKNIYSWAFPFTNTLSLPVNFLKDNSSSLVPLTFYSNPSAPVNLATQCTTTYSLSQGGYSAYQYLYPVAFYKGIPQKVIDYAKNKCYEAIGLNLPTKEELLAMLEAKIDQAAPQKS